MSTFVEEVIKTYCRFLIHQNLVFYRCLKTLWASKHLALQLYRFCLVKDMMFSDRHTNCPVRTGTKCCYQSFVWPRCSRHSHFPYLQFFLTFRTISLAALLTQSRMCPFTSFFLIIWSQFDYFCSIALLHVAMEVMNESNYASKPNWLSRIPFLWGNWSFEA